MRGVFHFFSQNWLPWQHFLRYRKKRSRSIICTQNAEFGEKIAKIGPVDPEIIVLRAIIKKEIKKEKEINASIYSSSGKFAERAKSMICYIIRI